MENIKAKTASVVANRCFSFTLTLATTLANHIDFYTMRTKDVYLRKGPSSGTEVVTTVLTYYAKDRAVIQELRGRLNLILVGGNQ